MISELIHTVIQAEKNNGIERSDMQPQPIYAYLCQECDQVYSHSLCCPTCLSIIRYPLTESDLEQLVADRISVWESQGKAAHA